MTHDIAKELEYIFLYRYRTVSLHREDPFGQLTAKGEFGKTAEDLYNELKHHTENPEFIKKILVVLFGIGYMLDNQITLKDDRIMYYNQQLKQVNHSHYEEIHKLLVEMENETARVMSGQELLDNVIKRIEIAEPNIELCQDKIRSGEKMRAAGYGIVFLSPIVGIPLIAKGQADVNRGKEELEQWQQTLNSLEQEKENLQRGIEEKSREKILQVETKAKQLL